MNTTTKRYPRSMAEAFPADRFNWADRRVMLAVAHDFERCRGVDTSALAADEFVSTMPPLEAASAVSEFGHDDPPKAQAVSLLQIIKRRLRALVIKRMKP